MAIIFGKGSYLGDKRVQIWEERLIREGLPEEEGFCWRGRTRQGEGAGLAGGAVCLVGPGSEAALATVLVPGEREVLSSEEDAGRGCRLPQDLASGASAPTSASLLVCSFPPKPKLGRLTLEVLDDVLNAELCEEGHYGQRPLSILGNDPAHATYTCGLGLYWDWACCRRQGLRGLCGYV